jgi:galactokinase
MDVEEVSRAMSEALRRTMVSEEFKQRFGQTPTLWAQAPGRLDLMGSHTDYNECYVITMAIDRNTWMAARPRSDRKVLVRSLNMEGSGLSSSAAIEVVTATTLKMLAGNWEIEPVRLALLCQRAENEFVGMNCGVLDQYSSALGQTGHALLLDCRNLTARTATLHDDMRVVICDTRAERELTGSEYGERREQCEEGARRLADFYPAVTHLRDLTLEQFIAHEAALTEVVAKRCRFIIEENQRVLNLADALSADDRAAIRALTEVSYAGAHDLFGIGAPSMEAMMKAMRSGPGVVGARQTGAGFGGCMVAFVEAHAVDAFAQYVSTRYRAETAIEPEVYPVRAAVGAGPLDFSGKT